MEEIERWPKRPFPKTSIDNIFIKETLEEERKHPSSQTGKQQLTSRSHGYVWFAPRSKKQTFSESGTDLTLSSGTQGRMGRVSAKVGNEGNRCYQT